MTAAPHSTAAGVTPDAFLPSTSHNVVWGRIPTDRPPALRIKSGQTVSIDTVTHQGINKQDPITHFGAAGIAPDQVLHDAVDIFKNTARPAQGAGAHVLTGPIHIEEALPGDMLEVRIRDIEFRVAYGQNHTAPGWGVLPELLAQPASKVIRLDLARRVALFSNDIEVPLAPFMGIMAVAPPGSTGISTKPPGSHGGNMDLKQLKAGATLYLPVFHAGALFYTGDGHAAQGDGEVDGTAIEISLTPTLQFIVHPGAGTAMRWPRAEDAAHYCVMGMDADLDIALKNAVREAVELLKQKAGLSAAEAYALASLSVDFRIAEAVNIIKMVYGMIPKQLFRHNPDYWRAN
jgi:acetamidase/formamidase